MAILDSNQIIQIGIVVKDIEASAKKYAEIFGVEHSPIRKVFPNITYKGKDARPEGLLCGFPMGNVSIELIQPDETPTSWKKFLDEKGEGVHHLGVVVKDLNKSLSILADNGIEPKQQGGADWGSYTLVDSEEALGVTFNIKCNDPFEKGGEK